MAAMKMKNQKKKSENVKMKRNKIEMKWQWLQCGEEGWRGWLAAWQAAAQPMALWLAALSAKAWRQNRSGWRKLAMDLSGYRESG